MQLKILVALSAERCKRVSDGMDTYSAAPADLRYGLWGVGDQIEALYEWPAASIVLTPVREDEYPALGRMVASDISLMLSTTPPINHRG